MYAAIETSFDETGIAICDPEGRMAASLLASQVERHKPYGGCVPELAARTHLSDLPQMWRQLPPELVQQVTHLGVTSGPGLPGCLLAGVNFARGVARALRVPLFGLNHLAGHVFSAFIPENSDYRVVTIPYPHLALLVSGGHTELFLVKSLTAMELLGQTRDDAVGELLDKISALLGYGYPGGAVLELKAREYPDISDDARYRGEFKLPVPMRDSGDLNFSYSGLKTAVLREIRRGDLASDTVIDAGQHPSLLAALFSVVAESLWIKVAAALEQYPAELVTVSGGVAINGFIRARFAAEGRARGLEVRFPQPRHCLDNAEMIAWLLKLYVEANVAPVPFDAHSNWNPGL
ncbi:tRNA (adenosine(37)-N6)-threonylcarbamoyltransferase complex transferase subunit TsaD [bacterium]|nr:tRNA (adenosine(37)-N6)-threonylcarbamoyltransferase complex transferase subunit TsaD [bacterium]